MSIDNAADNLHQVLHVTCARCGFNANGARNLKRAVAQMHHAIWCSRPGDASASAGLALAEIAGLVSETTPAGTVWLDDKLAAAEREIRDLRSDLDWSSRF